VKRKTLIVLTLTLIVGVLVVAFWMHNQPPKGSMVYESDPDPGKVWFRILSPATNITFHELYDEQRIHGQWQKVRAPGSQSIHTIEQGQYLFRRAVPPGDHVWRMSVKHTTVPDSTIRLRYQLSDLAGKRRWWKLVRWLQPVERQITHSPEMRGNKPVEKK
jgi:hypothetical protein